MDPVRVPPHVFALDETSLTYLSLDEGGELYCRDCLVESLAEDCFQAGPLGGRLRDQENLSGAVEALLGNLIRRPAEASLVVPDSWMRLTFVDSEEWPRRREEQLEVLRFKLGRIVPFRVEELRIAAEPVPAVEGGGSHRFLVAFAIDSALVQVEEAFEDHGVRIGNVSNQSLSLFSALAPGLASPPLGVVVRVDDERYSLIVTRQGEPAVYRSKTHAIGSSMAPVGRELRLTRSFLQERVPPGIVSEIILAAPDAREGEWSTLLEEVFERPVASLDREWPSIPGLVHLTTHDAAPLLGAALREVA
ncbi:MAG: hypothetical protein ACE5GX_07135 [Thermoanaerobaculia bacterium]